MIKCFLLIHRAPHLSLDEFICRWAGRHAELAVNASGFMGMKRYVQNHGRTHPISQEFQTARGCLLGNYDGIAEAWFASFEEMARVAGTAPADVMRTILQDEGEIFDLPKCVLWFAEEHEYLPFTST